MRFENVLMLEVTSADMTSVLCCLSRMNVTVENIQIIDALTARLSINYKSLSMVRKAVRKYGAEVRIVETRGLKSFLSVCSQRPVLIICVLVVVLFSLYLPSHVLFVETEGMQAVSSKYVIDKAAECGIRLGASRRKVRSEEMKNKLLSAIPQLHWAGVNTNGCVAVISVEEKSTSNNTDIPKNHIGSIVASRDGIITSCTVQKGAQLCRVGQAVQVGEVLVSGYIDSGIVLQATCAEAEITAKTLHKLEVITPTQSSFRCGEAERLRKYSLQLGKKLINFFKDSGICGSSCVKMYSKKYWTLPGGRKMPIAVIMEQHMHYPSLTEPVAVIETEENMNLMAEAYLRSQMIAGDIANAKTKIYYENGYCRLLGLYSCTETISRIKYEGLTDIHG